MTETEVILHMLKNTVDKKKRKDLFAAPICCFSDPSDPQYEELKTIIGHWHWLPAEILPEVKTVISFFIPFTKEVTASVRETAEVSPLWTESYEVVNGIINQCSENLVSYFQDQGYDAASIRATHTFDEKTLETKWSHRSAAAIGGLGTFGVNHMLITEKGSSGRFGTVLTTKPLPYSENLPKPQCTYYQKGKCLLCVKVCPAGALEAHAFHPFRCYEQVLENKAKGWADVCGKCIAACPKANI